MSSKKNIQSIERALGILEFIGNKGICSLADISSHCELNKSTASKLVTTLKNLGYVAQPNKRGSFQLAIKLFSLGRQAIDCYSLKERVKPIMKELANITGETVNLSINEAEKVVCIERLSSHQVLRTTNKIGARTPMYCTAAGKVFLTYFKQSQLDEWLQKNVLEKYTTYSITCAEELMKDLIECKRNGYALDNEEYFYGVKSLAVPIFGEEGQVEFVISIVGPASRMTDENIYTFSKALKTRADLLNQDIGYLSTTNI